MKISSRCLVLSLIVFSLAACTISVDLTPTSLPPTQAPTDTVAPMPTTEQVITVYFTDEAKFAVGTEPYEVAVSRPLPAGVEPMRAVLDAFFAGPTPEESAAGLRLVSSGFNGVSIFTVENGIARIHLAGACANNGAAYSVANLIAKNLSQFPQITAVKIYDENDSNLDPDSAMSSLPYCLEP